MKRLALALLLASPLSAAAQQVSPFAPHRFDYIFAGSQLRIAAFAGYGGNSVDLLAITSAGRIIDDFVASDILLVGGLFPGSTRVLFGSRGGAGVFTNYSTGPWHLGISAEAASYAAAQLPEPAANLLRKGNAANATIDTRNLFARALVTREIGLTAARRAHHGALTIEVGGAARLVTPVVSAAGRIDPLHDGPALVLNNDLISAQADVVHAEGRADGNGFAFDFFAGITVREVHASISVVDVGRVRITQRTHHRAVDVQNVDLEEFAEYIDATVESSARESQVLSLPRRIEARVSTAFAPQVAGGLFLRHQSAGDLGVDESAVGVMLGWSPVQLMSVRGGVARLSDERWTALAGAGLEFGRVFFDVTFDADGLPNFDRARGIVAATSLGVRF